jgi:hypothetical protein
MLAGFQFILPQFTLVPAACLEECPIYPRALTGFQVLLLLQVGIPAPTGENDRIRSASRFHILSEF